MVPTLVSLNGIYLTARLPSLSVSRIIKRFSLASVRLLYGRNTFGMHLKTHLFSLFLVSFCFITIPLFIAILLDLEPRFYKLFRVLFFLPTILSVSAVAIIFKWQFDTNNGFVNAFIELFGFDRVSWLNSQPGAWIAILVTTVWWTIGTNTVIFSAGLKEVDKQMYEAAD